MASRRKPRYILFPGSQYSAAACSFHILMPAAVQDILVYTAGPSKSEQEELV